MRSRAALALVLVVGLGGWRAHAAVREDDVDIDDAPPEIEELDHDVNVHVGKDRVADYRVTRTLRSNADAPTEATLMLRLPAHGTLTGFRVGVGGQLVAGRARPADEAADRYDELRTSGPAAPRTVALASWEEVGLVAVSIFPVFPGERTQVEYDVVAPLDYDGGRLHATYPREEDGEPRPTLHVHADWADARIDPPRAFLPGADDEDADDGLDATITPPRQAGPIAARFAVLGLAHERRVVRVEVDAAPALAPVPRAPHVVFVLDGSWSEDEGGIAAQLALVRGYLSHVPDASVELVVFARRARRVFGELVPAAAFESRLAAATRAGAFAPANGSDAVAGLTLAADLLAGTPATTPARVVLLTDRALPRAYTPAAATHALARLPRGAIVHVVERSAGVGDLYEERIDGDDFGPVVAATGGQMLAISGDAGDPGASAAITLGLVRPIRIDDFAIVADDDAAVPAFDAAPAPLLEGEGFRAFDLVDVPVPGVTLRGRIWGRAFEQHLRVDAGLAARLPALVFGDEIADRLTHVESEQLGLAHGLVTPATSLLVEPAGANPSTVGFDDYSCCSAGMRGRSASMCGSIGCTGIPMAAAAPPDAAAWLAAEVAPGAASCARAHAMSTPHAPISLAVESIDDEIVGVAISGVSNPAARACLEDAAWAIRLTADFRGHRDHQAAISLPGS